MSQCLTARPAIRVQVVEAGYCIRETIFFFLGLPRDKVIDDSSAYHLVNLECVVLTHSCYSGLRFETKVSWTAGLFPLLLSWGRTLHDGTQSGMFVWQWIDWPLVTFTLLATRTATFVSDAWEFKFLFLQVSRTDPLF